MATRRILSGPSKWDLIIEALGRQQTIEFTFEGIPGNRQVRIQSVGLEDGSGQSWLLEGDILDPGKRGEYQRFSGYYTTKHRSGTYSLKK